MYDYLPREKTRYHKESRDERECFFFFVMNNNERAKNESLSAWRVDIYIEVF